MADYRIETLRHYYGGCDPHRKIVFCEPHPHRSFPILFNIILIIGQYLPLLKQHPNAWGLTRYSASPSPMGLGLLPYKRNIALFWGDCALIHVALFTGCFYCDRSLQKLITCIYKL